MIIGNKQVTFLRMFYLDFHKEKVDAVNLNS